MRRIVPVLLIACAAMAADAAPAKDTVNPAIAAQVSNLMQKNADKVTAANAETIKGLKALLARNKKDKAASVLIAIKIHKLDANDADALVILKDVPADQQDLLGTAGDAGKYLTDVQAKAISDALTKGKFTAKDWEGLPGKAIEVSVGVAMNASYIGHGQRILAVPCPDDKWRRSSEWPLVDWRGSKDGEMRLSLWIKKDDGSVEPQTQIYTGAVIELKSGFIAQFKPSTGGSIGNQGSGLIRVKLYEVVPVGE